MQVLCSAVLIALPLALVWLWVDFGRFAPLLAQRAGVPIVMDNVTSLQRWLGFTVSAVPMALTLYGVWHLRQLFRHFRDGELFSDATTRHLFAFAVMLFLSALASPVASALTSVVLTMGNPPGQRALSLQLGSGQLAMLFLGGVFTVIAWIMREGHKLAIENREIV